MFSYEHLSVYKGDLWLKRVLSLKLNIAYKAIFDCSFRLICILVLSLIDSIFEQII